MIPAPFGKLVRRHAKSGVVVDTNLLLLLWIGSFDRTLVPRFKRTSSYLQTDYDLLLVLLEPLSKLIVTPHILTEVSNLCGQLPEALCQEFRAQLAATCSQHEERSVPATLLLAHRAFPQLGLADVGLVELAAKGSLVVTDDLPLTLSLQAQRLPILNFTHLRRSLPGYL